VIAAWRFGGTDTPTVQGIEPTTSPVHTTSADRLGLEVRAVRGASFMEVRVGSRAGKPLYQGTLERGQLKRFAPQKLVVTLRSPENVVVRVGGKRVTVPKSGELKVDARASS
jgi:hypothetical protein